MKIQLIAFSLLIFAATHAQSTLCSTTSVLEVSSKTCHRQVTPLIAPVWAQSSIVRERSVAPRSPNAVAFAVSKCPIVPFRTYVSKTSIIRGKTLKNPQCVAQQTQMLTAKATRRNNVTSLAVRQVGAVTRTSKANVYGRKANVAISSPRCIAVSFDSLKTESCPNGHALAGNSVCKLQKVTNDNHALLVSPTGHLKL